MDLLEFLYEYAELLFHFPSSIFFTIFLIYMVNPDLFSGV